MNSTNERIKCPYCLSDDVTIVEDKEQGPGHFHGLCSSCGKQFEGYASPINCSIQYKEPNEKECCCGDAGRSSESYEEEINRLKHEKEYLLLAIENLSKTINILMDQMIREVYRSK